MWRHAGVRITGLVAKAPRQNVLSRLRRQVRMQNELPRVDAELFPRSKLKGVLGTRREIDRGDVETRRFDHCEPSRNQSLFRGRVGVDVQPIGHAKVKINLGGTAGGHIYLRGIKELNGIRCSQRQGLVFDYLQQRCKPGKYQHGAAKHLFAPGGQRLLDAGLHFIS